jgi:hypothetical protein
MSRKTLQLTVTGMAVVLALTVLTAAPAAAQKAPTGSDRVHLGAPADGSRAGTAKPLIVRLGNGGRTSAPQPLGSSPHQAGLGWFELGIGAGILLAIFLFGMWGYIPVGAIIFVVAALIGMAAKVCDLLAMHTRPRRTPRTARREANDPATS